MDDELSSGVWQLDPATRTAMRLDRVRSAFRERDYTSAIVEVEELLDEEPANAEALFLLGESLLEVGDAPLALEAYTHHIELGGGDRDSLLGLAIARFETCDLIGAIEASREVIRLDASVAEAHWYLGLALERLDGRQIEALAAFAAARELQAADFPYPLELTEAEWHEAVRRALRTVHPSVEEFWYGVPLKFEDLPNLAELRAHLPPVPPTISALYQGKVLEEEDPWAKRPQAIRIFRKNLARSHDEDELVQQIALALQSEALDWLGLISTTELD
jgi:tetratricopeptide (TPR) repeat protein